MSFKSFLKAMWKQPDLLGTLERHRRTGCWTNDDLREKASREQRERDIDLLIEKSKH